MRRRSSGGRPPALVRALFRLLLPREDREFYLGDLEERGRVGWLRRPSKSSRSRTS